MNAQRRSWWELPQTPAWGFSLGALWAVIATVQWIGLATDDDKSAWRIFTGVVATLAAIVYVGPAIVQLRRKRRGAA